MLPIRNAASRTINRCRRWMVHAAACCMVLSLCTLCVQSVSLNFTLLVFPVKEYSKTIHSGYSAVAYQPDKKRNGKFEDPRLEEMSGYRAGMRL